MKKSVSGFYFDIIVQIFAIVIVFFITESFRSGIKLISFMYAPFLTIILFNFYIRKNLRFKSYLLSKYNPLTSKRKFLKEFDFSKDILFHKLLEVIDEAGYKIIKTNENTGDIFAITFMTWIGVGENIYIKLNELSGKTTVEFLSVHLIGGGYWDKNKINYQNMLEEFEKSLII